MAAGRPWMLRSEGGGWESDLWGELVSKTAAGQSDHFELAFEKNKKNKPWVGILKPDMQNGFMGLKK